MAQSVGAGAVLYACESLEEPFVYLSHHEVVERRALVGVPLLGKRRGAVAQLEAVARRLIMVQHGIEQVVESVLCKRLKQVAVAHVARCQACAVRLDVCHETVEHALLVVARKSEIQRQGVGCLAARAVGA